MARMIPPSATFPSNGEREVFRLIRDDPATEGWTVLHSLDLAQHRTQLAGEVDFVVIVPRLGVLCVEVKGCSQVRRSEDGLWYYGRDRTGEHRGPFRQAAEGAHSLRRLAGRAESLRGVPFWSAVVFPFLDFRIQSHEWNDWQIVDAERLRQESIGAAVRSVLQSARDLAASKGRTWLSRAQPEPDPRQCEQLVSLMRPSFEVYESPASRDRRLADEIKAFTQEQYAALDAMEGNSQVLFDGPAGTGKTMLAIEAARRSAAMGKSVLLLCFNRLLGRWLQAQVGSLSPGVTCRTLHSQMLEVTGCDVPVQASDSFWSEELPAAAIARLLSSTEGPCVFDELIIDELQDIAASDALIDFIDLSLDGGLRNGAWRMFGDVENQVLYGRNRAGILDALMARVGNPTSYALRVNCRNTPRVASWATVLSQLRPGYTAVRRPDDGVEPRFAFYTTGENQAEALCEVLAEFSDGHVRGQDIIVLSARAGGAAATKVGDRRWRRRLRPIEQAEGPADIGYCSVHAFKGLERSAVVVTDIATLQGTRDLLYVGMTRALKHLVVLLPESLKEEVMNLALGTQ